MVEHEREPGNRRRRERGTELVRQYDEVVAQPRRGDRRQPRQHRGPGQPLGVLLDQDGMADATQVPAIRPGLQFGERVRGPRRLQVHPSHHRGDQVAAGGQREELQRLGLFGDGLHHDGRGHPRRGRLRPQFGLGEVPQQPLVAGTRQPRLLMRGQIPDMVVRVHHGFAAASHRHPAPQWRPPSRGQRIERLCH